MTRFLFIGDSITDGHRSDDAERGLGSGYVPHIAAALERENPADEVLNRGVSGDRARDLLRRWEDDCLSLQPQVVTVLVGVNDTWRRYDSDDETTAADFEAIYRELLEQLRQGARSEVVLMTPFLVALDADQALWNADLDPKIAVVARLAAEFDATLVPLDRVMTEAAGVVGAAAVAGDGVHPSPYGDVLIAAAWLAATTSLRTGIAAPAEP